MNMKRKILMAIVCAVILLGGMRTPAIAIADSSKGDMQLQWANIVDIYLGMNYSGGEVNWTGRVKGLPGTTKITATYKLEKQNSNGKYTLLDTWSASTTNTVLYASDSYSTGKGTFRLSVTTKVTTSGRTETASDSLVKTLY